MNNTNLTYFTTTNNPNLYCVLVDDPIWSNINWTFANGNIDSSVIFTEQTNSTSSAVACDAHTWNGTTYTSSGMVCDWLGTNAVGLDLAY